MDTSAGPSNTSVKTGWSEGHSRGDEETDEHEASGQLEAEAVVEREGQRVETVEEECGEEGDHTLRGSHQTEQTTCTRIS